MKKRFTAQAEYARAGGAQAASRAGRRGVPSSRRDIIPLDTHSIRHKALRVYHLAERDLDRLKSQLKRHHDDEVPGFRAWLHRTFGHLLTRQRELARAIEEKRALLIEIEDLADRYNLSDAAAYRKARWRQDHSEEAEREDREFAEAEERRAQARRRRKGEDADPWAEDNDAYDPFAAGDFESIPDEAWDEFSDFFEEMTGTRPPPRNARSLRSGPHPEEKSTRALYRTIVRRLHPDHHGQMSEARKQLWHEAQDAYRRRDLNALYGILARCDDGEAGLGQHSPVALIRRLTRQIKDAVRAAKREIRRMQRDPAWDYQNRVLNPGFVRRVEADLKDALRELEWQSHSMSAALSKLERQANRPAPKPAKPRNRSADLEPELPF
jgi:hypothetical protein